MIQKWWNAFDGDKRQKSIGAKQSLERGKKNSTTSQKVSWGSQDVYHIDRSKSPQKEQRDLSLKESQVKKEQGSSGFGNYRANWNPEELSSRRPLSPEKQYIKGNVQSRETPYQKFEKSISSHAKKVEENPPESFSEYSVSWDDSI